MRPEPEDKLAASVFALGLRHGFIRREDVVRWADGRIEASGTPPVWLIDLSLSQTQHLLDVIGLLDRVAAGVDSVLTCKAVYALLPDVSGSPFDRAERFAARVYVITAECLKWDWSQELMSTTDKLADDFDFLRDGYLDATEGEVIGAVQQFVLLHRDEAIVRLLHPVTWSDARE